MADLTSAAGGALSSLLSTGPAAPPNLTALFQTIQNAGANQQQMIDALPAEIQQQYKQYAASNAAAGAGLSSQVTGVQQGLMNQTAANYSPAVAQAAEDAAKTAIYANVPGQQAAIRQALAATGGLQRGQAATALAAPVINAGAATSQNVENVTAQQLQAKQQATQQAINTVAQMGDQTATQLFGMNVAQATAILNGNRQDLKDQLTQLIAQSQNQTNQTLGVEGTQALNQYNYNAAENARQNAITSGLVNLGVQGVNTAAGPGFLSGLGIPASTGYAGAPTQTAPAGYSPGGSYNSTIAGLGY